MAMGRRKKQRQGQLWVEATPLRPGPGHPFYQRLNEILGSGRFGGLLLNSAGSDSVVKSSFRSSPYLYEWPSGTDFCHGLLAPESLSMTYSFYTKFYYNNMQIFLVNQATCFA